MLYRELSIAAQTAYAEILDRKQLQDIHSLSGFPGSFHSREIKGATYWYFGYRDINRKSKMVYIGPDSARVRALIDRFRAEKETDALLLPHVEAAIALGCQSIANKHFRIVERLGEYGLFKAGGVLIGTHAYNVMGNMLGVRWGSASMTADIDFAHAGNNISLALPSNLAFDARSAIDALELGMLPIAELDGRSGTQYRNPLDSELRIDFLTCMHHEPGSVHVPNSSLVLEPLKFMEFSLESVSQGCALSRLGACVVNLPLPERFAVHKLIVCGERPLEEQTKSNKDVVQAASIISWLLDNGQIAKFQSAWADAMSRGKGWVSRATEGQAALVKRFPDLSRAFDEGVRRPRSPKPGRPG